MTASSQRTALLDVNVIVALLDQEHPHFRAAQKWFLENRDLGWATCPITENGAIRVLSNRRYSVGELTAQAARDLVVHLCGIGHHHFWANSLSLLGYHVDLTTVAFRQITDIHLLATAIENGARFATFDRRIPARLLGDRGREALEVIPV
jgi:toxin-antitoxin system PIN domain toxin